MDARDLVLKARESFADPNKETKEGNDEARQYLLDAIRLDPNYALAHGKLSYTYVRDWENDWSAEPHELLAQALKSAKEAVKLGSDNHWNLAIVYSAMGNFEEAMAEYAIAGRLDPENCNMRVEMGEALIQQGRSEEAVHQVEKAIAANPGATPFWHYWVLARALYMTRRYDQAVTVLGKIKPLPPELAILLAACLARQSDEPHRSESERAEFGRKAHEAKDRFLALAANRHWTVGHSERYHWRRTEDRQHWLEGLALAGLPRQ